MSEHTWTVSSPQAIDIDAAVTKLRALIIAGRVSVIAHEHPGTRIEVTSLTGRDMRVTLSDSGELTLDYPFLTWDNPFDKVRSYIGREAVDIAIAVPRDASVGVTTVSGDILIAQVAGAVTVNTVSGQLTVDQVAGDISIKTVSGPVLGRDLAGTLSITGVSSGMTLSGELSAVTAHTVSGAILLDTFAPDCDVRVDAVSANVTVRRPAGTSVALDVTGFSGRVVVDTTRYDKTNGRLQMGNINASDGLRLRVKTMNGNVTVMSQELFPDPPAGGPEGGGQG